MLNNAAPVVGPLVLAARQEKKNDGVVTKTTLNKTLQPSWVSRTDSTPCYFETNIYPAAHWFHTHKMHGAKSVDLVT